MLDRRRERLRYGLGNSLRLLTRSWRQYSINPEQASTIFACSFGDNGWHHLRHALTEFDANPSIAPSDSSLGRYLKLFCPSSISVLAGVHDEEPLPLFVYPWGTFSNGSSSSGKDPWMSRFCGPSTSEFVDDEFRRTIILYKEFRVSGYRPTRFPNSYIGGTWLQAEDGRKRFVVMQGNHRMAILAHLGATQIHVRTIRESLPLVCESEIDQWPLVASGKCSIDHARRVFHMFFSCDGHHIRGMIQV
jgi:hypothetical protein